MKSPTNAPEMMIAGYLHPPRGFTSFQICVSFPMIIQFEITAQIQKK